jgi:hypothetical protein
MRKNQVIVKHENRKFVYILWGDEKTGIVKPRIKREAQKTINDLKTKFPNLLKQSLFFSIGKDAKNFLESQKLYSHIHYSDENYIHPIQLNNLYQRHIILSELLNQYKEIISLDWDTWIIKDVDDYFWDFLNSKKGFFSGDIQTSMVCYNHVKDELDHRKKMKNPYWLLKYQQNTIPCTCFLYIRNKELLKEIMECFYKYPYNQKGYVYTDENYLVYLIDHKYGIKDIRWLDENLHCRVVKQTRLNPYLKSYSNPYFWHN